MDDVCMCEKKRSSEIRKSAQKSVFGYGQKKSLACIINLKLKPKFNLYTLIYGLQILVYSNTQHTQLKCTWHVCDKNMDFN